MAGCSEEQQMELEALEALFTHDGEFTKLSPTSFRLMLLPTADQPEALQRLSVTLDVVYPAGYPETELPQWTVSANKGCDAAALEALRRDVQAEMEKQRGSPMMYTIAEFIQEWLRIRSAAPVSMYEQMVTREDASEHAAAATEEEEDEEQPQQDGVAENGGPVTSSAALADRTLCNVMDRCTKEEFDRWAEQFREEMIARGVWKGLCGQQRSGVLTGRQLFERDASLATADNGELDDVEEAEANFKKESGDADEEETAGNARKRNNSRQPGVMWKDENLFTVDDPDDLPSD